jgi:hypothetical protein
MVKVLDHSDKAELFTHTMKAYQGMAKARAMAHVRPVTLASRVFFQSTPLAALTHHLS